MHGHGLGSTGKSGKPEAQGTRWKGKTGQTEKGLKCQAEASGIYPAGKQTPTEGVCCLGQTTRPLPRASSHHQMEATGCAAQTSGFAWTSSVSEVLFVL